MRLIDNKFLNYTEKANKDIKYAVLLKKFYGELSRIKSKFNENIAMLKDKNYTVDNIKNKNLLLLSIEEEINKQEFKNYIIENINKNGKLSSLLDEKAKNDKLIANNKAQIKKDENYLNEKYLCTMCKTTPRTVLIKNCNHLLTCDSCIKKISVCPKCNLEIEKYEKIFR